VLTRSSARMRVARSRWPRSRRKLRADSSCPALVNLHGPWWPAVRPPGPMIMW